LRDVGESTRRRFNLINFDYQPPVKDLKLEKKLRAEWSGILRWMINGCLDWQRNGLQRPDIVRGATELYFAEQDIVARWIEDECERGRNLSETNERLFAGWKEYAETNGDQVGTKKWFLAQLGRLGYTSIKDVFGIRGRGFLGLKLRG
jgi:putative DNA primase/helicase